MADRAHLDGQLSDGTFKWCVFPCQKLDEHGHKIDRVCRVSVDPNFNGHVWTVTGPPDAPTLSPSVDCQSLPCWHGNIVNGELQ